MRKNATMFLLFIAAFLLICQAVLSEAIDYDDEFNRAARLRGREAEQGTDYLIKNTTEVLHRENLKTHAELEKLKKEIEELKKMIKEVKDIVEG